MDRNRQRVQGPGTAEHRAQRRQEGGQGRGGQDVGGAAALGRREDGKKMGEMGEMGGGH